VQTETLTTTIDGWTVRWRPPQDETPVPALLMLHGWTGDEDVMWIFAPRLPERVVLIAPRAPHPAPRGGYSWTQRLGPAWPTFADFTPAVDGLLGLLTPDNFPGVDFQRLLVAGFSQGAALTYSLTARAPERVQAAAGLAGFLPEAMPAPQSIPGLAGKPLFVTHGTQDEIVPVARGRQAVDWFEQAGAQVSYCEDAVGHKLSASCFRSLETFFAPFGAV
jgi:phospholipase/carboxylesterase